MRWWSLDGPVWRKYAHNGWSPTWSPVCPSKMGPCISLTWFCSWQYCSICCTSTFSLPKQVTKKNLQNPLPLIIDQLVVCLKGIPTGNVQPRVPTYPSLVSSLHGKPWGSSKVCGYERGGWNNSWSLLNLVDFERTEWKSWKTKNDHHESEIAISLLGASLPLEERSTAKCCSCTTQDTYIILLNWVVCSFGGSSSCQRLGVHTSWHLQMMTRMSPESRLHHLV